MNKNYLLSNRFRKPGWFLLILGIALGIYSIFVDSEPSFLNWKVFAVYVDEFMGEEHFFSLVKNNVFGEIIGLLIIVGGIMVAFSKEKSEDEFISGIRLSSLVWATYVNYGILLLSILFIYDISFFWVLVFNMFTILFIFIIRFHWALNRANKQILDEE